MDHVSSGASRTTAIRFLPVHHHALLLFAYLTFAMVACYVCWDLNILSAIYKADRSFLTSIIAALVILASVYACWHAISNSHHIESARQQILYGTAQHSKNTTLVNSFIEESRAVDLHQNDQYDAIVEIYADKIRSPVELGWFLVDLAVRMGLVGTIIGFILIFTSMSDSSIEGAEGLKELLVTMSGGMGTALFTTLCGLIGATIISVQFMVLGRQSEYLIGLLLRLSNDPEIRTNNDASHATARVPGY